MRPHSLRSYRRIVPPRCAPRRGEPTETPPSSGRSAPALRHGGAIRESLFVVRARRAGSRIGRGHTACIDDFQVAEHREWNFVDFGVESGSRLDSRSRTNDKVVSGTALGERQRRGRRPPCRSFRAMVDWQSGQSAVSGRPGRALGADGVVPSRTALSARFRGRGSGPNWSGSRDASSWLGTLATGLGRRRATSGDRMRVRRLGRRAATSARTALGGRASHQVAAPVPRGAGDARGRWRASHPRSTQGSQPMSTPITGRR
jgi:hypothetical protein